MRKFSLVSCIICILLFFTFQVDAHAEVDSNKSVEEYYNPKDETDNNPPVLDTDSDLDSNAELGTGEVSVTIWDYVKMIFALLFVVLLLYGLLRIVNRRNRSFQTNQLIQNLGGVGISQGKSVQLLKVGNSLFLVGIGEDVSLLKEITDPEEITELTKVYEEKQEIGNAVPHIMEIFSRFKSSFSSAKTSNEKNDPSFNETFQKRLQEIKKDRSDVLKDWKTKEREENE